NVTGLLPPELTKGDRILPYRRLSMAARFQAADGRQRCLSDCRRFNLKIKVCYNLDNRVAIAIVVKVAGPNVAVPPLYRARCRLCGRDSRLRQAIADARVAISHRGRGGA